MVPTNHTYHMEYASRQCFCCVIRKSKRDRILKLVTFLTLTSIPTIIVIIQNIISLQEAVEMYRINNQIKDSLYYNIEIGKLVHELQLERGTTALFLSADVTYERLVAQYIETNLKIKTLTKWQPLPEPDYFQSRDSFIGHIRIFRSNNFTVNQALLFYSGIIATIETIMTESMDYDHAFTSWGDFTAYKLLIFSKEQAGIERALGSIYFAKGSFSQQDLLWFQEKMVLGVNFLNKCNRQSVFTRKLWNRLYSNSSLEQDVEAMRNTIILNAVMKSSVEISHIWFDNMTSYIGILENIQTSLANRMIERTNSENSLLQSTLAASAVQLTLAIIMFPVVVVLVTNVVNISFKLQEKTKTLEEEKLQTEHLCEELEKEKSKTVELLYQLLPKPVAQNLMETGNCEPESFASASIMFSDVVGFTKISSNSTPMQVVDMLNMLYRTMDARIENYDVYKVETIGDGYMVASGIPIRNETRHVVEIAKLSLDLLESIKRMKVPHMHQERMALRLGFNTGPCVAGVVGVKMPRYCIFGDTVNTASRMESTGLPLKIQMTESSATHLQKSNMFFILDRGEIQIKGKGLMKTYWLEGYA